MNDGTHKTRTDGGSSLSLLERLAALKSKKVATAVGVAAAAAVVAGAVAFRRRRGASGEEEEESIFLLRQDGDSWLLEAEGASAPEATFATKQEGLAAARELARKSAPCELVIYRTDGSIQDRHAYEAS